MEYNKRFIRSLTFIIIAALFIQTLAGIGIFLLLQNILRDDVLSLVGFMVLCCGIVAYFIALVFARIFFRPLQVLSEAIVYAGHSKRGGVAPDPSKLRLGKQMITALTLQVYDLASMSAQSSYVQRDTSTSEPQLQTNPVEQQESFIEKLGLPAIGIDSKQIITLFNHTAAEYIGVSVDQAVGRPLYDVLKLSFHTNETFELWLQDRQKNGIVASRLWERVRIVDQNSRARRQFDMAASYSKDTGSGTETMLCFFDKTDVYGRDDQEISFVALAVHELRTPLTIMKGYIEVFEDEVGPNLNEELRGFMHKMQASAQQLTAFVGNILNVARVEENQLVLKLQQHSWPEVVKAAVDDLALRASVHNIRIELDIADNLPAVAIDRTSIHEILNNLVDNAIKYSGTSNRIVIHSVLNSEGFIETSVQDFGIGIPTAVMPDLFQKFYRSHKSRVQVGGTGLGLYLCKALVDAHGGHIWVRSKEGEGSVFTFTVEPYDRVKHEQVAGQDGIMRGAHGWIKNHSFNRQ